MNQLPDKLRDVSVPGGSPRFFPVGKHPAVASIREQLRLAEDNLSRQPDSVELLKLVRYLENYLRDFEYGEYEAKINYLLRHSYE